VKIQLNLASRIYVNRRGLYAAYLAGTLVLVVLLLFSGFFLVRHWRQLDELDHRLAEVERRLGVEREDEAMGVNPAAYENLREKIAEANAILVRDSFRWTELFDRFEAVLPPGVSIRRIQPRPKDKQLDVSAVARGNEQMQDFLDRLIGSDSFQDVFLLRQEKIEIEDYAGRKREAVRFSLSLKEAF